MPRSLMLLLWFVLPGLVFGQLAPGTLQLISPSDLQPLSPADLRPLSPADLRPISPADLQPLLPATQPPAVLQPVSPTDLQPATFEAPVPGAAVTPLSVVGVEITTPEPGAVTPDSEAYVNGYRAGYWKGRREAGGQFRPYDSAVYQQGDEGYEPRLGPLDRYRQDFKAGFVAGYDDGQKQLFFDPRQNVPRALLQFGR